MHKGLVVLEKEVNIWYDTLCNSSWDHKFYDIYVFISLEIERVELDELVEDVMNLNIEKDEPKSVESLSTVVDLES